MASLAPLTTASVDTEALIGDRQVEELLSEKLLEGYSLLDSACPQCVTPLVTRKTPNCLSPKKTQPKARGVATSPHASVAYVSVQLQPTTSDFIGTPSCSFDQSPFQPVSNVPYCVSCKAHVVTKEAHVGMLERAKAMKDRGSIIVAISQDEREEHNTSSPVREGLANVRVEPTDERDSPEEEDWQENSGEEGEYSDKENLVLLEDPYVPAVENKSSSLDFPQDAIEDESPTEEPPVDDTDATNNEELEEVEIELEESTFESEAAEPEDDDSSIVEAMNTVAMKPPPSPSVAAFLCASTASAQYVAPSPVTTPKAEFADQPAQSVEEEGIEQCLDDHVHCMEKAGSEAALSAVLPPKPCESDLLQEDEKEQLNHERSVLSPRRKDSDLTDDALEESLTNEEILQEYEVRRDIATKVLGAKMLQGYSLMETQCLKCGMPLMSKADQVDCVVCPVLVKKAKKKAREQEEARRLAEKKAMIEAEVAAKKKREEEALAIAARIKAEREAKARAEQEAKEKAEQEALEAEAKAKAVQQAFEAEAALAEKELEEARAQEILKASTNEIEIINSPMSRSSSPYSEFSDNSLLTFGQSFSRATSEYKSNSFDENVRLEEEARLAEEARLLSERNNNERQIKDTIDTVSNEDKIAALQARRATEDEGDDEGDHDDDQMSSPDDANSAEIPETNDENDSTTADSNEYLAEKALVSAEEEKRAAMEALAFAAEEERLARELLSAAESQEQIAEEALAAAEEEERIALEALRNAELEEQIAMDQIEYAQDEENIQEESIRIAMEEEAAALQLLLAAEEEEKAAKDALHAAEEEQRLALEAVQAEEKKRAAEEALRAAIEEEQRAMNALQEEERKREEAQREHERKLQEEEQRKLDEAEALRAEQERARLAEIEEAERLRLETEAEVAREAEEKEALLLEQLEREASEKTRAAEQAMLKAQAALNEVSAVRKQMYAKTIAQAEVEAVAEAEAIVKSEAEDYKELPPSQSFITRERWETLRIEGRALMTRRVLQGWTVTSVECKGAECKNNRLISFKNRTECTVCGGTGTGLDGVYQVEIVDDEASVDVKIESLPDATSNDLNGKQEAPDTSSNTDDSGIVDDSPSTGALSFTNTGSEIVPKEQSPLEVISPVNRVPSGRSFSSMAASEHASLANNASETNPNEPSHIETITPVVHAPSGCSVASRDPSVSAHSHVGTIDAESNTSRTDNTGPLVETVESSSCDSSRDHREVIGSVQNAVPLKATASGHGPSFDECPVASRTSSLEHGEATELPKDEREVIGAPPKHSSPRATTGHVGPSFDECPVSPTSSTTKSVSEMREDFESKRNYVSKEIGKKMMKGWMLLDMSCPDCLMPLLSDPKIGQETCVLCGPVAKLPTTVSTSPKNDPPVDPPTDDEKEDKENEEVVEEEEVKIMDQPASVSESSEKSYLTDEGELPLANDEKEVIAPPMKEEKEVIAPPMPSQPKSTFSLQIPASFDVEDEAALRALIALVKANKNAPAVDTTNPPSANGTPPQVPSSPCTTVNTLPNDDVSLMTGPTMDTPIQEVRRRAIDAPSVLEEEEGVEMISNVPSRSSIDRPRGSPHQSFEEHLSVVTDPDKLASQDEDEAIPSDEDEAIEPHDEDEATPSQQSVCSGQPADDVKEATTTPLQQDDDKEEPAADHAAPFDEEPVINTVNSKESNDEEPVINSADSKESNTTEQSASVHEQPFVETVTSVDTPLKPVAKIFFNNEGNDDTHEVPAVPAATSYKSLTMEEELEYTKAFNVGMDVSPIASPNLKMSPRASPRSSPRASPRPPLKKDLPPRPSFRPLTPNSNEAPRPTKRTTPRGPPRPEDLGRKPPPSPRRHRPAPRSPRSSSHTRSTVSPRVPRTIGSTRDGFMRREEPCEDTSLGGSVASQALESIMRRIDECKRNLIESDDPEYQVSQAALLQKLGAAALAMKSLEEAC